MDIVLVGSGKVGESLCTDLIREGHALTLIDKNSEIVFSMSERMDLKAVTGNGSVPEVQKEAGVADCDIFISATPSDEINIVACVVASRLGAKHCVARIRNPEYTRGMDFGWERIGISMMMNSDYEAAREIIEEFDYPTANYVEPFSIEQVKIIKVRIKAGSHLDGVPIYRVRSLIPQILICSLQRGEGLQIPKAQDQLRGGDAVHIIGKKPDLSDFIVMAGHSSPAFRSAFIIGGGITARYLLPALLKRGIAVRLIERDKMQAQALALEFPKAEIIIGDGTDQEFLIEQRLDRYDVSIALTNIDEENLLFSLFAHRLGVRKTVTKVSRINLIGLLDSESLDTIVTPRLSVANGIIRYVRSLNNTLDSEIEDYHRLDNGVIEAVVFLVKKDARVLGIPLRELRVKEKILLGLILRADEVIVPSGDDQVLAGDRVIVISMQENVQTLDDILEAEA